MLRKRRKLSSKLAKNQLFLPGSLATSLLFPFSLRRGLQPPPLISSPSFPRNTTSHPSPSNLTTVTVPLSLPLFSAKLFFPLHHRNSSSRSSGNHPLQRLSLPPAAARVASPSTVTPTAPAASFPSPLQESAPSSFSREQCKPPASPPSVTPCTTS